MRTFIELQILTVLVKGELSFWNFSLTIQPNNLIVKRHLIVIRDNVINLKLLSLSGCFSGFCSMQKGIGLLLSLPHCDQLWSFSKR
jgi:hypothetical protein